jgi:hypothetical protein
MDVVIGWSHVLVCFSRLNKGDDGVYSFRFRGRLSVQFPGVVSNSLSLPFLVTSFFYA